jgi:hypothetical protein
MVLDIDDVTLEVPDEVAEDVSDEVSVADSVLVPVDVCDAVPLRD